MTTETDTGAAETGPQTDRQAPEADAEAVFRESMQQFAEGATALTAASIRMQMMMLEQAREMMGDLAHLFGENDAGGEAVAQGSREAKKDPARPQES